jgi:hypothetical protein
MDTPRLIIILAAVGVLLAGVWLMRCGHRHELRRDRRADDRIAPR